MIHPDGAIAVERPWRIWVDTGGTFTDCLGVDPAGAVHRAKVLSSSALRGTVEQAVDPLRLRVRMGWEAQAEGVEGFRFRLLGAEDAEAEVERYDAEQRVLVLTRSLRTRVEEGAAFEVRSAEEAPVLAARLLTGTRAGEPLPPLDMRLATTRGTNALLERTGAPVAFFVTRGFRDLLRIGTQQRPDLFALAVRRPDPLSRVVVEVQERLAADGTVLQPLDLAALAPVATRLADAGVRVGAVALLHSWRSADHELALRELLLRAGFEHVSCSAELAPALKVLPRAETAVVDAYLSPVVGGYLERVREAVGGGVQVMTSAGGLVRAEEFRAKDSLLSGPAGGVVGAALAARRAGFDRAIAFDMGGTSTDVARIAGDFEYVWEHEVAGARLMAPALAIHTVAAGGGSVCAADAVGLRVGPESAGADPGPACYGAGGPLTLTDANLLLGRLEAERFGIPIDPGAAFEALERLRERLEGDGGGGLAQEPLLEGLLAIANETMADAIREISLRRGHDPAEHALVAFGGAGGQHACAVAERLGIGSVVVPADAGLLSALGIGRAVVERFAERQVLRDLSEVEGELGAWLDELGGDAADAVMREGAAAGEVEVRRRIANLRYRGQEATLAVDWREGAVLREEFERRHHEVYGHAPEGRTVELESLRVVASTRPPREDAPAPAAPREAEPAGTARSWIRGGWREVPAFERADLSPGSTFRGPALVWEAHSATVVDEGWEAVVDGCGSLVLRREAGAGDTEPTSETPAVVVEELFVNRFRSLVGEMGEVLRRTALSTNVKERMDFSCALLDPDGALVTNAPHIPVHLGALGLCVRSVRQVLPLGPGDVAVTNHPGYGGSHLPDVTVITPVHDGEGALLGYVASRAHHAEIGGSRPGSMPPGATLLAEEGVVIPPSYLARAGEGRWEEIRARLEGGPHPSRAVADNLADLAAQVAANRRGAELLRAMARAHGAGEVQRHMDALQARSERLVREALLRIGDGVYEAEERLDDGSPLAVRVDVSGGRARVDFTGSAAVHPGNLNATPAVVRSVVLYVLRLLVQEPIPLNEGLLRAVDVVVPEGILSPSWPRSGGGGAEGPAVVGGNTETSQRLVDALLRALRVSACSQGTMNNVLWGTDKFGYYETVCGGAGAGPGWNGESGVHTHMTNTRITDPEVVEHRYPVRVERFGLRRGSGGAGRWRGGEGVVRELTFLAPMSLSVLSQHRVEAPYGMEGGMDGATGRQKVVRASGEVVRLAPVDGCEVGPGDRLILETPGGGGWGAP